MKYYFIFVIIGIVLLLQPLYSSKKTAKTTSITVSVSKYCTGNKYCRAGNPMANGEWPHQGACATSDYKIKFGTKVIILGKIYVVKDRTAKWVHKKYGLTFDIYEPSLQKCLTFGRKKLKVKLL